LYKKQRTFIDNTHVTKLILPNSFSKHKKIPDRTKNTFFAISSVENKLIKVSAYRLNFYICLMVRCRPTFSRNF